MPALSFMREWINPLLSGDKTQTTRKPVAPGKPPRFIVGDLCHVYVEQRGKITGKPVYPTTKEGRPKIWQKIIDDKYPPPQEGRVFYEDLFSYYAHFLGIVRITDVATIQPSTMTGEDLESWAWSDGFYDFDEGDRWFVKHHSDDLWADQKWDVIQWNGWVERYFDPKVVP